MEKLLARISHRFSTVTTLCRLATKTGEICGLAGFILFVSFAGSDDLRAQQSLQMEGTEITGNRELPMVLYIVPWKSAQRFEIETPPITSIMDQKLAPLERAAFKRTIHYHEAIYSKAKLD